MNPDLSAGGARDALGSRHAQGACDAGQVLGLGRVELVITAHDERHDVILRAFDEQRLHAARRLHLEHAGELIDGTRAGCRHLGHGFAGRGARLLGRQSGGRLEVGGIVVLVRENDRVFPGGSEYVELL